MRIIICAFFLSLGLAATQRAAEPLGATPSAKLILRIEQQAPLSADQEGIVTLHPLAGGNEPLTIPLRLDRPTEVALAPGSRWEVRVELPKIWVRGGEVVLGGPGSETELRLLAWPWAKLKGRLKLPLLTGELPREVTITTLVAPAQPRKQEIPQGVIPCPVDKAGAFLCDLPAATYDLVLAVEGLTPAHRQRVRADASKVTDLGLVSFTKGASVAGWVAVEGGTISKDLCRAKLRPFAQGQTDPALHKRLGQAQKEVQVRGDGFFQIVGVSPGTYVLEVEQPEFARALVPSLEVWPGAETFLREPVVLRKPLRIEIRITPAVDWLGKPWGVQVFRDGSKTGESGLGALFSGEASADGIVQVPNQAPGAFSIFVDDSRGNRLSWQQSVQILGPETALQEIHIEFITISGTLLLGKEPLAGTLWFGGRYGAPRVEMESDQKGKFLGVLPRDGAWLVAVAAEQPVLTTEVWARIEPDRTGRARVEIRLADTRLFGRVLDERGSPGKEAEVMIQQGSRPVYLKTDELGLFETRGLQPAPLVASARRLEAGIQWSSSPVYLGLIEGQSTGPIELRLRRSKKYSGSLVSDRGPVVGAEIFVGPLSPKSATGGDNTRSDLSGRFEAQIDGTADRVLVAVMAPSYALQVFGVSAGQSTVFSVSPRGGTVILENPPGHVSVAEKGPPVRTILFQNRVLVPPALVTKWMFDHGAIENQAVEKWEIPALAPGTYQACRVPLNLFAAWLAAGGEPEAEHCVEGILEAGGSLVLRPPLPSVGTGSR